MAAATMYSSYFSCSKHVKDSNKCIIEEIVRQVGYLPESTPTCFGTNWLTIRVYRVA
jgi:hypothetical protein